MRWLPLLLAGLLMPGCVANKPAVEPTPGVQAHDQPPALVTLDRRQAPWSEVFVSGRRNIVVFMTPW